MNGLISTFRERLPLPPYAPDITLGEGNTPLVKLSRPSALAPVPDGVEIYVKVEGANPSASFKDRGMVVATSAAVAQGARCLICASTGNTSASASAYAARAGLPCIVLIPEGKVAAGKIAQAVAHGAQIIRINGNFDHAMHAVKRFSEDGKVAVVNSINPMRLQGQKTASLEIVRALGDAPDYHALPVGNAGNITAHWFGYCEAAGKNTSCCAHCKGKCPYLHLSEALSLPVMLGYQAEHAAPFVFGMPVVNPETVATAIRIGNPQSYDAALMALSESKGRISAVSDEQILKAQKYLASQEGVFCEPASAASVAGVVADIAAGQIKSPARIVCTLTGHGLKDPDIIGAPQVQAVDTDNIESAIDNILSRYGR